MNFTTITPENKRLRYLDAAKGWGICMIVFGHITSLGNPIDIWFGSYKLSLFFIVSGYLLCMRQTFNKYTWKSYFLKQIQTLLIPYFGYSVIVIIYNILVGLLKGQGTNDIFHKFLYQLYTTCSLRGISALWFLPSLFIGQLLLMVVIYCPKWVKFASAVIPLPIASYSAALLPQLKVSLSSTWYSIVSFPILTISKGLLAFWFIGSGYIAYSLLNRIRGRITRFALGIFFCICNIYLSQINRGVDLNMLGLGKYQPITYINGIIGALGAILILEFLEKWWKMSFLNFCGKYSLIIMATHGTLGFKSLLIAGWSSVYSLAETPGIRYYLECTGILLELMLMECGVIRIIEAYFPWLMGKSKKKIQ